ncbi:LacI family DNA-binding transcriptional regulator [Kineococcus gypseus]|uniref:LacI family DNA-binding transcriptional regulator n=1 Tax=Kineococcus gypseus TaxID=1637102 RepID=UPI003D7EDF94
MSTGATPPRDRTARLPAAGRREGRVTIVDVARAAGVSVATVSKAVNRRDGVAPATHRRVMAAAAELGYDPAPAPRPARRRTGVVAVLVAEFEPFSLEVLRGASRAVGGSGYELLAHAGAVGGERAGWEHRSLARLAGTLVDGAVVVAPTAPAAGAAVPVVAVDPRSGPSWPATVDPDDVGGACAATRHLLDLGHRRIAHVRGRADLEHSHLRELGYREALRTAGVPLDPALVRGGHRAPGAREVARALLALPQPPTAVFAADDAAALRVVEAARGLGLRVPGDLSVVGFEDVPGAARCTPALTTVVRRPQEVGAEAVRLLLDLLEGRRGQQHVRLPAHVVVRGSTGPAPGPVTARAGERAGERAG